MEKHIKRDVYDALCSRDNSYQMIRSNNDDIELKHKHSNENVEDEVIFKDYIQLVKGKESLEKQYSDVRRTLQDSNDSLKLKMKELEKNNEKLKAENCALHLSLKDCDNKISNLENRIRNICLSKVSRKGEKCTCMGTNESCQYCWGTGYLYP